MRRCSTRCATGGSADHAEARAGGGVQERQFASAYNVGTPPENIVGGGPWRVVQYVPGEKTVLGRNPYYYGFDQNKQRLPYLTSWCFSIVPDQDAADLKFRAGELDGLDNVKPENYKWYEENQKNGQFHAARPRARAQQPRFFWFNLNKVQPPVRGAEAGARQEGSATPSSIR